MTDRPRIPSLESQLTDEDFRFMEEDRDVAATIEAAKHSAILYDESPMIYISRIALPQTVEGSNSSPVEGTE